MAMVLIGSLQPSIPDPDPSWIKEVIHNALHVPAYAFLAFLLLATCSQIGSRSRPVMILIFVALYGGMIEILQGSVPGRTASFFDAVLNTFGAFCAISICHRFPFWQEDNGSDQSKVKAS